MVVTGVLAHTAFGSSVGHIFSLGPNKEVIWANAGWVVATMADVLAGRDRAIGKCPCDPWRQHATPPSAGVYQPIPGSVDGSYALKCTTAGAVS